MSNAKINYIQIIEGLQAQFSAVLELAKSGTIVTDEKTFEELETIKNIFVSDEQYFVKGKDFDSNNIYIAIKFGSATVNFASSVLSLSLRVMATENKIKPTQLILGEFVTYYNLGYLNGSNNTITQVWNTPTVASNYNPTNSAFRTLFNMNGVVVVGQDTVDLASVTYITDNETETEGVYEEEEVGIMSYDEGYQASNNPQPFGNTNGFAVSEVNFGTNTLTFSTYLLDSQLVADCMHARGLTLTGTGKASSKGMNDTFKFRITYTNGYNNNSISMLQEYKLISYRIGKKIGDIPSFVVSFSY